MNKNIAIKVENLTKMYPIYNNKRDRMKEALSLTRKKYHKDFYALDNISFEIKTGETIGIIGQNGSGKSTLLKILTGVLSPTLGNVRVNGKVSALLELGAGFNPEMTGIENIYLNGTIMGYSREDMDKRIANIVEFADIGDFINQPVKNYSSGMFVRLAFAVAINVEPEILIVDEALAVGDVFFQNKCFKKIIDIKNQGITIILVSHDITIVRQLCNSVIWLDNGGLVQKGNVLDVTSEYMNQQIIRLNETYTSPLKQAPILEAQGLKQISNPPHIKLNSQCILSEEVEIFSFFILDEENNIVIDLFSGKSYTFHLLVKFEKDFSDLIAGVKFEDSKGIEVFTCVNTIFDDETFHAKKDQQLEIIFKATMPKFRRGEYLATVAIAQGTQLNYKTLTYLRGIEKVNFIYEGYDLGLVDITEKCIINEISIN